MSIDIYTIKEIQEIITPIFKKHNISKAYLVGDYARGSAAYYSDIDFFLIQGDNFFPIIKPNLQYELEFALKRRVKLKISDGYNVSSNINLYKEKFLIYEKQE